MQLEQQLAFLETLERLIGPIVKQVGVKTPMEQIVPFPIFIDMNDGDRRKAVAREDAHLMVNIPPFGQWDLVKMLEMTGKSAMPGGFNFAWQFLSNLAPGQISSSALLQRWLDRNRGVVDGAFADLLRMLPQKEGGESTGSAA